MDPQKVVDVPLPLGAKSDQPRDFGEGVCCGNPFLLQTSHLCASNLGPEGCHYGELRL